MNTYKKISHIVLLLIVLLAFSCEESNLSYSGMPIDNEILGTWQRTYSVVSQQNAITVYTDTINFNSSNLGDLKNYRFNDIEVCRRFQFYTNGDSIYLLFNDNNKEEIWPYYIRNDSLIISERLPYKR
jgi:hypothetical protein